jgi:hypothetical protein
MRQVRSLALSLLTSLLAPVSPLYGQTITVTPGVPSVALGNTVQFSAQVNGLPNTAVTWSAGGVRGGNSTAGTISSTGLYTAPTTMPGQNPVQITATSVANTKVAGITYAYLLTLGPTITSVSPNPLAVGGFTVTVQGSGFQPGAMVYDNYGSGTFVQLETTSLTSTTIKATGYEGPASSASFSVRNPGSTYSNSISVAVGYTLKVVNGSGSGVYAPGSVVTITANAPPSGQAFLDWTGMTVKNPSASTTTLTMPASNATVTANYATSYALTVVSGAGGGNYAAGALVTITANAPPSGQAFLDWTGMTVKNPNAPTTTLTMPASNATVTANYANAYALTVVSGAGSGEYAAGSQVTIKANAPPAGQAFLDWTGATVQNPKAATTTLTMPASNATVTANYATSYKLTVVSGTGSGNYAADAVVMITANTPPTGQAFLDWTGATVQNPTASTTTLTMPASNATATANYATGYRLTVVSGTGGGTYTVGTVVTITANAPPSGESFLDWTGTTVQNPNATPTTLTMPASNATVTANYSVGYTLTVVNGKGGGTYPTGTAVTITANAPPSGEFFQDWTGAAVQNPNASPTTLTMPGSNTTVTANFAPPAAIPYPVSAHPRLWITPNDLPRLQSWATASNPVYEQGLLPVLQSAVDIYNTQFFPGGVPNPNYPDPGDTQGYVGYLTEQYGVVLAFNSLIDPSPSARIQYAQYARNLLMYAMNQAVLGHLSGAPFRDPMFAVYNRANGSGEQWPLIVDWIYNATDANGNPILTASDKATIRNVFMIWANDCLQASTTGGDHPTPAGVMNSLQLLPNNLPYRMAANNYYLGHARLLTMMALSIDPVDDPPLSSSAPPSQVGNSLRSYILDANGAWLYQEFAMFGDPSVVAKAYGVPGNGAGFGLASGGLPPEGMLYGESFGFMLGQLLALQTAGFNNVSYSGPQAQLITAPLWDRFVNGMLASLTPTAETYASEPWNPNLYEFASYGDLLRLWVTPDQMRAFALLAQVDQETGTTTHINAARWFDVNATPGGSAGLIGRVTRPWSFTESILYYMLLDPSAPAATDPRPTYPTVFYDPGAARIVAHSDWSSTNTLFDYRASWISINHQDGNGGQFELYRKGEWLTKEMSNYDNNAVGMTTVYHNTLALQNWCADGTPANLQWYETGEWANGSQWMEGMDGGDPTTVFSTGAGYVYAASNLTNLFNRPDYWSPNDAANNITQATRSIVWFDNDYVVIYDRATSVNAGLFKRFNLSLVTAPSINGSVATETMADGQQLFIQTLLPLKPSASAGDGAVNLNPIADLEPTRYIFTVEDPTLPADTRFLHVLQGADLGAAMAPATYLQSASGAAFDGAVFAGAAVYFPVSGNGSFTGTTLPDPAGVHTMLVTGLAPNGTYTVSVQPGVNGAVVSITPGSNGSTADGAGVLKLTF